MSDPQSGRRSLTAALLERAAATPPQLLSAIEQRVLAIAVEFLPQFLIQARCAEITKTGDPPLPLTPEVIGRAIGWSFRAACEVEAPLREIRDKIGGGA